MAPAIRKYEFRLQHYTNILAAFGLPEHTNPFQAFKKPKWTESVILDLGPIRIINQPPDLKHTTARYGFKEKIILKKSKITVELVHGLLSRLGVLEADESEAFVLAAVIGHDLNINILSLLYTT
jgi:hypothetical protein